jgi:hypothetical protein
MAIHTHLKTVGALSFCVLFFGCARNGLEGNAQYFGSNKPASGVKIEAKTNTDIKEEQSKASFTVTTDSSGHFNIKSLLPNKSYSIKSADPNFDSTIIYEEAPGKGTKIIKESIIVCPLPPGNGLWIFDESSNKFREIMLDINKKVQIRVHEDVIEGPWGYYSAFSISDRDAQSISDKTSRNGLLMIRGSGISDIAHLFKIPEKIVPGFRQAVIQEGWYYNISDFYEEPFMGSKLRKARVQKPNLEGAFVSKNYSLWALPLNRFEPGLYLLATNIASGQRASQVLFGESHPKEGFLIKVE